MSELIMEMYSTLDVEEKKEVDDMIYSFYEKKKNPLRNSKSEQEAKLAENALNDLFEMWSSINIPKDVKNSFSLNGSKELANFHKEKYESFS